MCHRVSSPHEGSSVNRFLVSLAVTVAVGFLLPAPVRSGDTAADRAKLKKELDALMGEILDSTEDGAVKTPEGAPDLVILGSADVRGEVAPCG